MGICSRVLYTSLSDDLDRYGTGLQDDDLLARTLQGSLDFSPESLKSVASLWLRRSILKKFEDEKSPEADAVALSKFLEANAQCNAYAFPQMSDLTPLERVAIGHCKDKLYSSFFKTGTFNMVEAFTAEDVLSNIDVGPGSSVGVNGQSFYHKVGAGRMTGTHCSLYSLYNIAVARNPLWAETEENRRKLHGGFVHVEGNRLTFVPKSRDVSRTICTEPLLNMLVQKGLESVFLRILQKSFGINLEHQQVKNRHLAGLGSARREFGTIDLSSASDTVSTTLIRHLLPPYVMGWLMQVRSPCTELPDGSKVPMHMISSMGNATTFPLQTLVFASVVYGVYRALNIRPLYPKGDSYLGNFAVNGDDIIVRREAYDLVVRILQLFGFSVNEAKSYNQGPFRESCGADFWHGHNVRGVYCKSLKTAQDRYSLLNRLMTWSCNHGIAIPKTLELLKGSVKFLPVPPWESDVAGVKVPLRMVLPRYLRKKSKGHLILYSRYTPRPKALDVSDLGSRDASRSDDMIPRKLQIPRNSHNPAGILLSAVAGHIRAGKITLRTNAEQTRYEKRIAVAPCWDYIDMCATSFTSHGWARWNSIWPELNLGNVE
jgi:hypothetical protein